MSTILVVEDEPVEQRLLYHALKRRHRVLLAQDERTALAALEREPVDLVILDMHLPPEPDSAAVGLRLQARIRSSAPAMPIIVTTSDTGRELLRQVERRGVTDFFTKPVDPALLEAAVERRLLR